jgi:hypothetical protein
MADPYIDNLETLSYGPFAVEQIKALVLSLDPDFTHALHIASSRLTAATEAMRATLAKTGELDAVTYKPAEGAPDPLAQGRATLRRFVSYAESREEGEAIVRDVLAGESLGTVVRRRPVKLAGALGHAVDAIAKHGASLPERDHWSAALYAAKAKIDALNTSVRQSRNERRVATPEIAAARAGWLKAYGAAKLIVEAVLRYQDKSALLPEIFDDLAEVHRAAGVSDGDSTLEAPPAEPT